MKADAEWLPGSHVICHVVGQILEIMPHSPTGQSVHDTVETEKVTRTDVRLTTNTLTSQLLNLHTLQMC